MTVLAGLVLAFLALTVAIVIGIAVLRRRRFALDRSAKQVRAGSGDALRPAAREEQ